MEDDCKLANREIQSKLSDIDYRFKKIEEQFEEMRINDRSNKK